MIKVILVDDHEMVRLGVSSFLQTQSDMEVIGEASNGLDAIELVLSLRPDIVLMDMVMPKMNGADATKAILEQWPEAKIMIVTSFLDDDKVYPALEAGAVSYIMKTSSANQIANAIRETVKGKAILENEVTNKMMQRLRTGINQELHSNLTDREMEILLLLAEGKNNQEIADELFIALKTVKTHVSNILSKLEVQDRTQAVVYAFQHDIVQKKN